MTTNETIARWLGWQYEGDAWTNTDEEPGIFLPQWDTDITLWHGGDGLLAEIERRGLAIRFIEVLVAPLMVSSEGSQWVYGESWVALTATPSKLAAALVEVIGAK